MRNKDYSMIMQLSPDELRKKQRTKGWAMSFVGLIVYGVLRLFGAKPKDYYGVCPYFEFDRSIGGCSFGWFFICGKNASERTKSHEVGHTIQNAAVGGLPMLFFSIGSLFRCCKYVLFGSDKPYDSWWFEGQATEIGTQYVDYIKNKIEKALRQVSQG